MNITFKPRALTLLIICFLLIVSCKKDDVCESASIADAGADQNAIGTSTTLTANMPVSGIGSWSIVSGADGTIADALNPASGFSGVLGNTYILKWSITGCPASEDEVQITFICNPSDIANAGADQALTTTTATLAANTPASGTGTWSIISGSGGSITNTSSPTSIFTGVTGTAYVLRWTLTCPASHDDVQITFTTPDPQLISMDKASAINGEIITITGANFSSNYNGGSQINSRKTADPLINQEVFLTILSRTATEIKAVAIGAGGGAAGLYNLRYSKKPDAGAATLFTSNLNLEIVPPGASQFITSSTFTATNLSKGSEASFGIKNGSLTNTDYTMKLLRYDFTTGGLTEYNAAITNISAGGYGGSMDKIAFTIPADLPSDYYYVKVTYGGKTLIGGWGSGLNIF